MPVKIPQLKLSWIPAAVNYFIHSYPGLVYILQKRNWALSSFKFMQLKISILGNETFAGLPINSKNRSKTRIWPNVDPNFKLRPKKEENFIKFETKFHNGICSVVFPSKNQILVIILCCPALFSLVLLPTEICLFSSTKNSFGPNLGRFLF